MLVAPAAASTKFKYTDHDWEVGVIAGLVQNVHTVPSGGTFKFCGKAQVVTAVTPDITYRGAPVGTHYEEIVGGAASGTDTITSVHNVDGDVTPLEFNSATGTWDNTYAIMSFTKSVHHLTLPAGKYHFEVVVGGKIVATTSLTLSYSASC